MKKSTSIVIAIVFLIFSVIYTFLNKPVDEIINYYLYFSIVTIAVGLIFYILGIKKYKTLITKEDKINSITNYFLIAIIFSFFYFVKNVISDILKIKISLENILSENLLIPFTVFIILSIGLMLFYFRSTYRGIYGIIEAAVGVIMAISKASPKTIADFSTPSFYITVLTVSLFLIVRGFDNIQQGLTKYPLDPILQNFIKPFKRIK